MKHTQGKWVSHQIEETDEFAIFSLNTFIAQTENSMINEEPTKSEKQANANLIASAPKTLALLKEMATDENELRFALCRLFGTKKGNSLSRQIKDLIAKAEG